VGTCGLYCGACPIWLAERHYPDLRQELADHFNCRVEQIACQGCHGDIARCWTDEDCRFRRAAGGEVDGCRVCRAGEGAYDEAAAAALRRLESLGAAAWLEEQAKEHACPNCGKPMARSFQACRACGTERSPGSGS